MRTLFHKILALFIAFVFCPPLAISSDSKQAELPALPIHFSYYTAAFELLTDCKQTASKPILQVCIFEQLTNKFDTYPEHKDGFYAWLRRRDQSWAMYDTSNTRQINLSKEVTKAQTGVEQATNPDEKTTFLGMEYPSKSENLKTAQIKLNEGSEQIKLVLKAYIGEQGIYRTLTKKELEKLIFKSVFNPRANFKCKIQHPYKTPPKQLTGKHRVKGKVLSPSDLKIAIQMLTTLNKRMKRDIYTWNKLLSHHESDIRKACTGWKKEQLENWWDLPIVINNVQKVVDTKVRKKCGPPNSEIFFLSKTRDLFSDRGRVLASLNRDPFSTKYGPFLQGIQKIKLSSLKQLIPQTIQKPQDQPQTQPIQKQQTQLSQVKNEKLTDLEEFFRVVYTGRDELNDRMYVGKDVSYNTLLNPVYLSATANTAIFAVFSRVVNRQTQVEASNDSIEIKLFKEPKETMMALEFRSFETLNFHRTHYQAVLKELLECFDKPDNKLIISANDSDSSNVSLGAEIKDLQLKRKRPQTSAEPDFDFENRKAILKRIRHSPANSKQMTPELYDSKDLAQYNQLLKKYCKRLKQQREHHAKLHEQLTYFGVKSYIPTPWSILFTEKPFTPRFLPSNKVDLSNAQLVRAVLKCPTVESAKQKYMSIFEPYKSIDLSENNLSGPGKFGFYWLVELKIHNCQLQALSSIKGFTSLRHLDVSENRISSDLSLESSLEPLASLTYLNISNNTLKSIEDFTLLTNLQTLDVSGNLITTLEQLSRLPIVTLNANYTSVTLNELMLPDELPKLETLFLCDCKNDTENEFTEHDFKKRYPALKSLTLEEDSEIKW